MLAWFFICDIFYLIHCNCIDLVILLLIVIKIISEIRICSCVHIYSEHNIFSLKITFFKKYKQKLTDLLLHLFSVRRINILNIMPRIKSLGHSKEKRQFLHEMFYFCYTINIFLIE